MPPLLLSILVLASAALAAQDSPSAPVSPPPSAEVDVQLEPAPAHELAPVQVTPAESARRLASLYEGTLIGVQDGQDFAETPAYRRLVEIVSRYGEQELRDKSPRDFDRAAALANPDASRGELVRVRGLLAGLTAERLSYPIGEHVDVFRAIVTEPNGEDAIVVDFLHQPPELELGDEMVETEAVFARVVGYVSKKDVARQAPYLIARDIRKWDTTQLTRRTAFDTYAMLLIGAAVAFLVIRILLSMRSKKGRNDDPARSARLIRERARAALQSRPPANKSSSKS